LNLSIAIAIPFRFILEISNRLKTVKMNDVKMTATEAILQLRKDPAQASLIRDSYLQEDVLEAAESFLASAELSEVHRCFGERVKGGVVLDIGAGNGIASYAFAKLGAKNVYALEPDDSEVVGRGAIARLAIDLPITILDGFGEKIELPDESVDLVYARQMLHHAHDLNALLRECSRVLKKGGVFIACREHVVEGEAELQQFLRQHPVHQLTGGEHAYELHSYLEAIKGAGLRIDTVLDPWDSVINAFPTVRSKKELSNFPNALLKERYGAAGAVIGLVPGVKGIVWKAIRKHKEPGRLYSFCASKAATV
jgi:ubiquinone/menaquinone biosynthesis C-methylase UbiE